jgi:dihydrofolate reductase
MRKIILAINVTPDGFCDHRAVIADDELHRFYSNLLKNADSILFGRKTFQLMEAYWPSAAENSTGSREEIKFARLITDIHKIVFSRTGINTEWRNTTVLNDFERK